MTGIAYASGWGGQTIYVIPTLDMVVVLTAENYSGAPRNTISILFDFIIPALQDVKQPTSVPNG